jgi:hypothetical protein
VCDRAEGGAEIDSDGFPLGFRKFRGAHERVEESFLGRKLRAEISFHSFSRPSRATSHRKLVCTFS